MAIFKGVHFFQTILGIQPLVFGNVITIPKLHLVEHSFQPDRSQAETRPVMVWKKRRREYGPSKRGDFNRLGAQIRFNARKPYEVVVSNICFYFTPIRGEMIQFDKHIFQMGGNLIRRLLWSNFKNPNLAMYGNL